MDELRFTDEQKQAMTDRLLETGRTKTHAFPRRCVIAAAAAAALLLSLGTAGATGVLKSASQLLAGVFADPDPAQTAIIDQIGRPIGASDTADGLTITAAAVIGDTVNCSVVYQVKRDDGTPWPAPEDSAFPGGSPKYWFEEGIGSHPTRLKEDPSVLEFTSEYASPLREGPKSTQPTTVCFRNLYYGTQEKNTLLAEGPWEITFAVAYEDGSLRLPAGQTFQLNGMTAVIDEITVSPLSVSIRYTYGHEADMSGDIVGDPFDTAEDVTADTYVGSLPLSVTLKDGTVIDANTDGQSMSIDTVNGKTVCSKNVRYGDIIPLKDIESVTVGNMILPVPHP